jgi:restriction endonuclease S subunit
MLLGEIAQIKTGLVLTRKKAEIDLEIKARYCLITLKNIQADATLTDEPIEIFNSKEELDEEYFTREGDVLIRLSHPNTAIYIDQDQEGLLIPSYFAKIRIHNQSFMPGYIAWYLNTEKVKSELLRFQAGTNIPSTNKNVLEQISIPEVDMEKQQMITHVQQLYRKEKSLYQKLMQEKEKLYKAVSYSIIGIK